MATIKVRGKGTVNVRPDEAVVAFEVASIADAPAEAFAAAAERATALDGVLDEAGIDRDLRSTVGIVLHEHHEFEASGTPRRMHRASTVINVRLADAGAIPALLQAAVERADAYLRGPFWRLSDTAAAEAEACRLAVAEEAMARVMGDVLEELGLQVQWQQVEDGRANVLGTWPGAGGGPTLMFNGHMDTSYSGREPWLQGIPGFQPQGFERDGRIYGLGISNMKGALACYVEVVRALHEAGVRLRGDVLIAAVAGEIEKTQQGDAQGAEYRGYAAGSRYLVSHGGAADMCILGEPTENKVVLAHFGSLWLRLSTHGPFVHT